MEPIRVKYEDFKDFYPQQTRLPEHYRYCRLLIRTRRRHRYYVVKGLSVFSTFFIKGFSKFKVIGWQYLIEKKASNNEIKDWTGIETWTHKSTNITGFKYECQFDKKTKTFKFRYSGNIKLVSNPCESIENTGILSFTCNK